VNAPIVAPSDLEAEHVVLAACLLDPESIDRASLSPDQFFSPHNGHVWRAITEIRAAGTPVDVVTVAGWLRDRDLLGLVGGSPFLASLLDNIPATAHVETHAARVKSLSIKRRTIQLAQRIAIEGGSDVGDMSAWLREIQDKFGQIADGSSPAHARWNLLSVDEIFAPLPSVHYLVEALDLCAGSPALVAGYGFSGKTAALQSAAVSIATGQRVWGTYAARQGRVIHLDYEQGSRLTRERYQRLAAAHMITPDELADRLALVCMPGLNLSSSDAERFLAKQVEHFDLAIVDSFRAACPGIDENSSEAREPLDMLGRISEKTGCAFAVIHHARKPSATQFGGAKMAVRGSGALFDACSSVLVLEAEKGKPTKVTHEKARTSGICSDDFLLRIEDREVGSDPRGGLVVTAEASEPAGSPSATFTALKERVLTELMANGAAASKRALVARVRGKATDKYAAIDQLVADGKLVIHGTQIQLLN
jgi:hypothetical protein